MILEVIPVPTDYRVPGENRVKGHGSETSVDGDGLPGLSV